MAAASCARAASSCHAPVHGQSRGPLSSDDDQRPQDPGRLGTWRPAAAGRDFARQLLTLCKETSLDDWLASLPAAASDAAAAAALVDELQRCLEVALPLPVPERAGVRGNALPKGTVPFSSNENRDSPPLASAHPRANLAAIVRNGLLEDDCHPSHRPLCEQGQRRLRP